MIESVCLESGYYYNDNGNICENDLFKDELQCIYTIFFLKKFDLDFHSKFRNTQHLF